MFDFQGFRRQTALRESYTRPAGFVVVREFVPGVGGIDWDGLNTPPRSSGPLWVDVDLDRAPLHDLQQLLPKLCPGFAVSRITDFFLAELESRADEFVRYATPDVSVVRSFDWLVTAWHTHAGHSETHREVERRWRELGAAGARTARDLAALFIEEAADHRGVTCQVA
jgi:hypothetical protein